MLYYIKRKRKQEVKINNQGERGKEERE